MRVQLENGTFTLADIYYEPNEDGTYEMVGRRQSSKTTIKIGTLANKNIRDAYRGYISEHAFDKKVFDFTDADALNAVNYLLIVELPDVSLRYRCQDFNAQPAKSEMTSISNQLDRLISEYAKKLSCWNPHCFKDSALKNARSSKKEGFDIFSELTETERNFFVFSEYALEAQRLLFKLREIDASVLMKRSQESAEIISLLYGVSNSLTLDVIPVSKIATPTQISNVISTSRQNKSKNYAVLMLVSPIDRYSAYTIYAVQEKSIPILVENFTQSVFAFYEFLTRIGLLHLRSLDDNIHVTFLRGGVTEVSLNISPELLKSKFADIILAKTGLSVR